MRDKRFKLIGAVVVALGVWAVCAFLFRPYEPAWQGRRLGAWLRDFEALKPEVRLRAADAVRHIGANAVPFLVPRLQHPDASPSSKWFSLRLQVFQLLSHQTIIDPAFLRPARSRYEAFAAVAALGPTAKDALPALDRLLHEKPPDTCVPYVIARIGSAGLPLLQRALTNSEPVIRLEARICLEMSDSRSENLFPKPGMFTSDFDRRVCEFNILVLGAAFQEHKRQHPGVNPFNSITDRPPSSQPPPDVRPPPSTATNGPSGPATN